MKPKLCAVCKKPVAWHRAAADSGVSVVVVRLDDGTLMVCDVKGDEDV